MCRGNDPRLRNDGLRGEAKLLAKIDRFLLYRGPDLFDSLPSEITKLNPYHPVFFPAKKVKADPDGVRGAGQTQARHFDEMPPDIKALSRNASPNELKFPISPGRSVTRP